MKSGSFSQNSSASNSNAGTAYQTLDENNANTYTNNTSGEVGSTTTLTTDSNGGSYASLGGSAGSGAKGNIAVNVASGAFNSQGNATLISSPSNNNGYYGYYGDASSVGVTQKIGSIVGVDSFNATAIADGNALSGASGNVGLNIASGIGNQQSNTLSIQP